MSSTIGATSRSGSTFSSITVMSGWTDNTTIEGGDGGRDLQRLYQHRHATGRSAAGHSEQHAGRSERDRVEWLVCEDLFLCDQGAVDVGDQETDGVRGHLAILSRPWDPSGAETWRGARSGRCRSVRPAAVRFLLCTTRWRNSQPTCLPAHWSPIPTSWRAIALTAPTALMPVTRRRWCERRARLTCRPRCAGRAPMGCRS